MLMRVIGCLEQVNIAKYLMSVSTDGAATEMSVHNKMEAFHQTSVQELPSTSELLDPIKITTTYIGGTPTYFPIDSKHTGKNSRSAVDSGARALAAGNHLIHHSQVAAVADDVEDGPLHNRDVYRRDKQDNRSMERFLSSTMLEYVVDKTPEQTGFIVYLFVFGEMHSAIQSRAMPHLRRIRILLTVLWFLDGWKMFTVNHPDYSDMTQFLSQDFHRIVKPMCTAMIGIILEFQKMDRPIALYPWCHSTEMLEHFFGVVRQQVKDLDALDLQHMASRISTLLRLDAQIAAHTVGNDEDRAGLGYQHTYNDLRELDIQELSTYFSLSELTEARRLVSLVACPCDCHPCCSLEIGNGRRVAPFAEPRDHSIPQSEERAFRSNRNKGKTVGLRPSYARGRGGGHLRRRQLRSSRRPTRQPAGRRGGSGNARNHRLGCHVHLSARYRKL